MHGAALGSETSAVLGASAGAGWELAGAMLAPRVRRLSAMAALEHRFFEGAAAPAAAAGQPGGLAAAGGGSQDDNKKSAGGWTSLFGR